MDSRRPINSLAFEGMLNTQISKLVGIGRQQVGLWRRRWQQSFEALVEVEHRGTHAEVRRTIEDVLSDAPRSGSPGKFTAEQVTQIDARWIFIADNLNTHCSESLVRLVANIEGIDKDTLGKKGKRGIL